MSPPDLETINRIVSHARQRAHPAREFAIKIRAALLVVPQLVHVHRQVQQMLRFKSQINFLRVLQTA